MAKRSATECAGQILVCERLGLPEDHLARFVLELVWELDVAAIEQPIQSKDPRGERPYDPRMMLALLVYGLHNVRRLHAARLAGRRIAPS